MYCIKNFCDVEKNFTKKKEEKTQPTSTDAENLDKCSDNYQPPLNFTTEIFLL